nr:thiamine diphosphokinase [Tissierella sp.]
MKGLIISSGEIKDYKLLKQTSSESDYIVCADGGVNHLLKVGMVPDMVIGDLDSIGEDELSIIKKKNIKINEFPQMKDETDTELCVEHLIQKGIRDITLMGVTGSRMDHTIANIYLLKKIYIKGAKASVINENNRIYYLEGELDLKRRDGYYISIIPLTEKGAVVSLSGFLYPLESELIEFSSTRGISNKIIDNFGRIKIHKGQAIIIESRD